LLPKHANGYWQRNIGGSTTRITTTNTNTNKYNGGTINTPSLTIYSVQQSDAGTYTCFGSNNVGTGQSVVLEQLVDLKKRNLLITTQSD
jgi:hypothetical protein